MNMQLTSHLTTRPHSPRSQYGGTFLGIILGVLLGLGAALAVAVYVTKVPVPFMNKTQSHPADQDAAEAAKNKDWDPNAPLYGKNPAHGQPATAASGVIGSDDTPVIPPADKPAAKPTPKKPDAAASAAAKPSKPPASAAKPSTADPLGDLAKAKTKEGSTPAGADPFTYLVQAGAFRTPEDAEAQRVKLGLLGMDAKVTEREQSGRTVYRVRVGPFNKKDDADKVKEKMDGEGFDTAMVRVQR
jgi:cell division protein FtsN